MGLRDGGGGSRGPSGDIPRRHPRQAQHGRVRLHNIFGGFNKGATKALHALSRRPVDRTVYENWAAAQYKPYWGQRISAAIVMADAKRCLHRLACMRAEARNAAAAPRAPPHVRARRA